MTHLTEADIDKLALEGCEIIGFRSGSVVAYDVAGYDRASREQVAPESLPVRSAAVEPERPLPAQAEFDAEPYPSRLAGFRRNDIYGPDAIGALLQSHAIPWNDGLGNGLYESLLINRKYGLSHVLEAPTLGFTLPFLESDYPAFEAYYPERVRRMKVDLEQMAAVYGRPLTGPVEKQVVLWSRDYPLAHFADAYFRQPEAVSQALMEAIGRPLPPIQPETAEDRAALARFWCFIRERQSRLLIFQADVLRELLGPGTRVIANPHELPPLDMEGQARAYDYPAVAIRPLLLDDDLMLRHYIAYYTQLYRDLTGKPPMISVRMNLSAATPRFVPTGTLIRTWYDQAVRHGAGAFYFWTRDYPPTDAPGTYDGPIPGNPVEENLPQERWESSLDLLGHLATHKRFRPPAAEVAILVPDEAALLHRREWRRIYAAFSAFAEARIHTRFLSDRQIARTGVPSEVRLLLAPALEFISPSLRAGLEQFTERGGRFLAATEAWYDQEGRPAAAVAGARTMQPTLFDVFPLDENGSGDRLAQLADCLQGEVADGPLDSMSWLFDISCANLPATDISFLQDPDPSVEFAQWLYEHGSDWIVPYLNAG